MTLTDNDIEIIESYFNRTLTEESNQAFKQRLQSDSDFRKAVNEYQSTAAILNTVRENEQKAFLKNVNATMPPVGIPIRRLGFRWLAVAAASALLITLTMWQLLGKEATGVKLKSPIAGYFKPYDSLSKSRGKEQKDNSTQAFEDYDAQKYASASRNFELAFKEKGDTILLFYQNIAALASGESLKAEKNLENLQSSNIIPQQALAFYLGIAAEENGNTKQAIIYLKKAASTEGAYQQVAQNALSILEGKH